MQYNLLPVLQCVDPPLVTFSEAWVVNYKPAHSYYEKILVLLQCLDIILGEVSIVVLLLGS